uniref:Knottins-like domain-containing protein n=1 Tax=Kalanchoe fedtschenkoi TaxID=63787 RepID=A0A7N0UJW7_KALFE
MVMRSDARECRMASEKFRGVCLFWRDCKLVCETEGFEDGKCIGFFRKCYCYKYDC